jgi:hypothetical protein
MELYFIPSYTFMVWCLIKHRDNCLHFLTLIFPLWNVFVLQDHVRGHQGNHGNEMADSLARAGAKMQYWKACSEFQHHFPYCVLFLKIYLVFNDSGEMRIQFCNEYKSFLYLPWYTELWKHWKCDKIYSVAYHNEFFIHLNIHIIGWLFSFILCYLLYTCVCSLYISTLVPILSKFGMFPEDLPGEVSDTWK